MDDIQVPDQDQAAYYAEHEVSGQNTPDLKQQYGYYAYGQTVAAVMSDDARKPEEITAAAARAGMDVVFGEDHTVTQATMRQISALIESQPAGYFGGIVLEAPPEMQDLFMPETLQAMSKAEFTVRFSELDSHIRMRDAATIRDDGYIRMDQYEAYIDAEKAFLEGEIKAAQSQERVEASAAGHYYDMAKIAVEYKVPVYAADVDRARGPAGHLFNMGFINQDVYDEISGSGLDDRSDALWLEQAGLSMEKGGKPLVIHRGYEHINGGSVRYGVQTEGMDDLLEAKGRGVLSVSVLSDGVTKFMSKNPAVDPDPADIKLVADKGGEVELDRGAYAKPSFFQKLFGR